MPHNHNLDPLSPCMTDTFKWFLEYVRLQGFSPTLAEMANNFGVSRVTMFERVEVLIAKGHLYRNKRYAQRNLRPTVKAVSHCPYCGRKR